MTNHASTKHGRRRRCRSLIAGALLPLFGLVIVPTYVVAGGDGESAVRAALEDAAHCLSNGWAERTLPASLVCLGQIDQAGRDALFRSGAPSGFVKSNDQAWAEIFAYDRENQRRLSRLLPRQVWFRRTEVGDDAADAAFLVVQHATNNPRLMGRTLRAMEPLLGTPDLEVQQYAMLSDRIALAERRPQTFGTQWRCAGGRYILVQPADSEQLIDQRRQAIGMWQTLAENKADIASRYPQCP